MVLYLAYLFEVFLFIYKAFLALGLITAWFSGLTLDLELVLTLVLLINGTCASRLFTTTTSSLIYSPFHNRCVNTHQSPPQVKHITSVYPAVSQGTAGQSRHMQYLGHCFQEDAIKVRATSHKPHPSHPGHHLQLWRDTVRGRYTEGEEGSNKNYISISTAWSTY